MELILILQILLAYLVLCTADNDWTNHCDNCKCMWSNGKKYANCRESGLNEIPKSLSTEIRDIDFTGNNFNRLFAFEFKNANLQDIHKLKLQNCSILVIDKNAFYGLELLIELDLSYNYIKELDQNIFLENKKLRILSLKHNKLKHLENKLFYNMSHLQQVFLNNNELKSISTKVFEGTSLLKHIGLSHNKIKQMDYEFIELYPKLNSLELEGNPWNCDCNLQKFRNATIYRTLSTNPIVCEEPDRLRGKEWSDTDVIFACNPVIIEPQTDKVFEAESSNVTLTCKVIGTPLPDVNWKSNGRLIDKDHHKNIQKYVITNEQINKVRISYLTVINVNYRDRGEYKCIASNPGGEEERNITLLVRGGDGMSSFGYPSSLNNDLTLIIILSVGAIILLIVIFILAICCCKRTRRNNNALSKNHSMNQSSESIHLDGNPEMKKALITDVNPLVKPPRQYTIPSSVTSGGTEVSETKKMLDDDSLTAADDESRSFDFDSRLQYKQPYLETSFPNDNQYPPDLLSFPPRSLPQISPAGSSASTVADSSRLPAYHGPQSPLHSPIYDTNNLYRTLPYSRSQSPFLSPFGVPVKLSRQGGYITIPRRPRQSWSASSEPPLTSDIGEPLYDNLGKRTTASGYSTPEPSTPKTTPLRPLKSPTIFCGPIAENDPVPSAATLPRTSSNNLETCIKNPKLTANVHVDSSTPFPPVKPTKTPPRPPPKPRKLTQPRPLFEDEGEDGTEV